MLAGILIAAVITLGWWLVCSRLPRVGVAGSVLAIGWITVGLFRARNSPPIVDPVPTATSDMLATVMSIAPLLAAAIGFAIALTRWTEARR